jgi:hypothetical protein
LQVGYEPAESRTAIFGGNSNWRGPIWMPPNYLLIEALERYHHFYGDDLRVEHPVGSGRQLTLLEVARDLSGRMAPCSCPTAPDGAPVTVMTRPTLPIRPGATCCCSTSTSTATRAAAWAPATKPAGPPWCCV